MFGIGNRDNRPENQIPYEVYETVQEPAYRMRRWAIRLVAILVLVTLLILGGVAIKNALTKDDAKEAPAVQTDQGSGADFGSDGNKDILPSDVVNQQPQQNTAAPQAGTPVTIPQSNADNSSTVRKPE